MRADTKGVAVNERGRLPAIAVVFLVAAAIVWSVSSRREASLENRSSAERPLEAEREVQHVSLESTTHGATVAVDGDNGEPTLTDEVSESNDILPEPRVALHTGEYTMTVRVYGLDGEVVNGAMVGISGATSIGHSEVRLSDMEATTGADGAVTFHHLPKGHYDVGAWTAYGAAAGWAFAPHPSGDVRLELVRGRPTSGTVTDAKGEVVSNAVVQVHSTSVSSAHHRQSSRVPTSRALTDAAGRFAFPNLPLGQTRFFVYSEDYPAFVTDWYDSGTADAAIVLPIGGGLSGRVVDAESNEAVPGIELTLDASDDPVVYPITAGEDGSFSVSPLRPAVYRIYASGGRFTSGDDDLLVEVVGGETAKALVLRVHAVESASAGTVSGRVYDPDTDTPVVGAIVRGQTMRTRSRPTEVRTDSEGRYSISGLRAGEVELVLQAEQVVGVRYSKGSRLTFSLSEAEAVEDADFSVSTGLGVSGVVVDQLGRRLSGVDVVGQATVNMREGRVQTDDAGNFFLMGFRPAETVELRVEGDDFPPRTVESLTLGDRSLENIKLVVDHGCAVKGIVLDPAGRPLPGVGVGVFGDVHARATTDAAGRFAFEGLAAGVYRVAAARRAEEVRAPETDELAAATVSLSSGEQRTGVSITFFPSPRTAIAGVVRDDTGAPVRDARIEARGESGSSRWSVSEPDGRFIVEGLVGTEFLLHAQHRYFEMAEPMEGIPAGATGVELRMKALASAEGRAIDAQTGMPITLFQVMVWTGAPSDDTAPSFGSGRFEDVFRGADGTFFLRGVPSGTVRMFCAAPGYETGRIVHTDIVAGDTLTGIEFRLEQPPKNGSVGGIKP